MKCKQQINILRIGLNSLISLFLLAAAISLKSHYSSARGEELYWILRPTAGLVEMATGALFTDEGEEGYLSRETRIRIAPSCAGVNFFIIAFLFAGFSGLFRFQSLLLKTHWIVVAGGLAYVMTLLSNTARIVLSICFYHADIYYGWITPERVHRMEGIVVYLLFLYLFHLLVSNVISKLSATEENKAPYHLPLKPFKLIGALGASGPRFFLFWYLAVVLGIPVLKGSFQNDRPLFLEHALTVLALSAAFYWMLTILQRTCRHRKRNIV